MLQLSARRLRAIAGVPIRTATLAGSPERAPGRVVLPARPARWADESLILPTSRWRVRGGTPHILREALRRGGRTADP